MWSEIANYTAGQIRLFLKIGEKLERERRSYGLIENAIASQGDKKAITKTLKDLHP